MYFCLATTSIRSPPSLPVQDREQIVSRLHVYKQDLQDELQHFKAFSQISDKAWVVSEGCLLMSSPCCLFACLSVLATLSSRLQTGPSFPGVCVRARSGSEWVEPCHAVGFPPFALFLFLLVYLSCFLCLMLSSSTVLSLSFILSSAVDPFLLLVVLMFGCP